MKLHFRRFLQNVVSLSADVWSNNDPLPVPQAKPQSLSESDVLVGNGKGVFLVKPN